MYFSVIIPVFNRPNEVAELLDSLVQQTVKTFEVIVVDDGSETKCDDVVAEFKDKLPIHYFYKTNSGPGLTRNFAAEKSSSEYLLILDSDCIVPPHYIEIIENRLFLF